MNEKTDKLLQQAGKYLSLEKLGLALEIYLKVQEMEPEDTTIINNIGDLYVRRGDNVNALKWYCTLAEKFEVREQIANAIAIYRKTLKLSPTDQRIIEMLADLYVRVKQVQNAKSQYQTLVEMKMSGNDHAQSLRILQKISDLDPTCPKALLELAKFQERYGWEREALENYLKRITFRTGVSYEQYPFLANGNQVKDFGINFGFSLPAGRSSMDLALKVGKRGNKAENILEESYFKLYFGITFNDQWFIKRKFD